MEAGTLEAGSLLQLVPPVAESGVQSIEVNGIEVKQAEAGEVVAMRLLGGQPSIGHVLCTSEEPLRAAAKFKAQLKLIEGAADQAPVITTGFRCILHLHQVTEECEVSKIIEAVDPRTKKKEASPKVIRAPAVALCVLLICSGREVPLDNGTGRFARFALRTEGGTIAAGKVAELPKTK